MQLAVAVLKPSLELLADADKDLRHILSYPLMATLQHEAASAVLQDNFKQIVDTALAAYDSGELKSALESGPDGYKTWLKGVGKEQKRKGKHLFMPMRVALTGSQHGPEVGEVLRVLLLEDGMGGPLVCDEAEDATDVGRPREEGVKVGGDVREGIR